MTAESREKYRQQIAESIKAFEDRGDLQKTQAKLMLELLPAALAWVDECEKEDMDAADVVFVFTNSVASLIMTVLNSLAWEEDRVSNEFITEMCRQLCKQMTNPPSHEEVILKSH